MEIPSDVPEPDTLIGTIRLEVSRVRLEADEEWRKAVERLQATRTLRRVVQPLLERLATPRDVLYEDIVGVLRPLDLKGDLDLSFSFAAGSGEDRYRFHLRLAPDGFHYEVKKSSKEYGEPWGGGVVPESWKEHFLPLIRKHPVVWELSDRIVRVVEAHEVTWEWHPAWNLHNIPVPQGDEALHTVFRDYGSPPDFVLLATWAFSLYEHDWGANGNRVQLLIDPYGETVVKAWEDEWHALY